MTTTTIYATNGGMVYEGFSYSSWSSVVGSSSVSSVQPWSTADVTVGGMRGNWDGGGYPVSAYQPALEFDTSVIPDDDEITAVELHLWVTNGINSYEIQALECDYGSTLEGSDWIGTGEYNAFPLRASRVGNTFTLSAYTPMTFDPAGINKAGPTRLILYSTVFFAFLSQGQYFMTNFSRGAGQAPKLVITHEASTQTEQGGAELPIDVGLEGSGQKTAKAGVELPLDIAYEGAGLRGASGAGEMGLHVSYDLGTGIKTAMGGGELGLDIRFDSQGEWAQGGSELPLAITFQGGGRVPRPVGKLMSSLLGSSPDRPGVPDLTPSRIGR